MSLECGKVYKSHNRWNKLRFCHQCNCLYRIKRAKKRGRGREREKKLSTENKNTTIIMSNFVDCVWQRKFSMSTQNGETHNLQKKTKWRKGENISWPNVNQPIATSNSHSKWWTANQKSQWGNNQCPNHIHTHKLKNMIFHFYFIHFLLIQWF